MNVDGICSAAHIGTRAGTAGIVFAGALSIWVCAGTALASTMLVPDDFATIQEGIHASQDGDTVLVAPGTYVENIWIDHDVMVRSAEGPAVTVIDGGSPAHPDSASVVRIMPPCLQEPDCPSLNGGGIEGFDIRNGRGTLVFVGLEGAGIVVVKASSPLIENNWIHGNLLEGETCFGAGIGVGLGGARIVANRIYDNDILSGRLVGGAGVYAESASSFEGNEIYDNEVLAVPPEPPQGTSRHLFPGAVVIVSATAVRNNVIACNSGWFPSALSMRGTMESNTIVTNISFDGEDGPAVWLWAGGALENNIISINMGPGIGCFQPDFPPFHLYDIGCSDIWGNMPVQVLTGEVLGRESDCGEVIGVDGNISVDPLYGETACVPGQGAWCLAPDSPLLPENSPPGCGLIGALGECAPIGVRDAEPSVPPRFQALPARPNPFAERTTIPFFLAVGAEVQVWIYNVLGRRLRTLSPGWLFAGDHTVEWDGRADDGDRAASGAYVARIRAGGQELTRTLLLIR